MAVPHSEETVARLVSLAALGLHPNVISSRVVEFGIHLSGDAIAKTLDRRGVAYTKTLTFYTAEEDDIIKAGWPSGKTWQDISAEILATCGTKRNRLSIRSRAIWLGVKRPEGWVSPSPAASLVPRKRRATLPRSAKVAKPKPQKTEPAKPEISKAPEALLIPVLEIRDGQCRFIVEDVPALMCGARVHVPGEAWCRYHRRIVYVPGSQRNRAARLLHSAGAASTNIAPFSDKLMPAGW